MSRTNPRLIYIALAMLAVTLAFKVIPTAVSGYSQLKADRESLRQDLIYYQDLIENEDDLRRQLEEARDHVMGIEESVFQIPESLFGSEVQAIVRNVSDRTGITIREMRVAKIEAFEDWYKVSQELSFEINQGRMLPFLSALRESRPRLYIRKLTISRSRQQFIGSLTLEAFSRLPADYD